MEDERLFKSIHASGGARDPCAGVVWSLPTGDGPGAWMPEVSPLVPFAAGYHLHTESALLRHHLVAGPRVWEAEARGEPLEAGEPYVIYPSARLVRELDWSLPTRLRVALETAREVLSYAGVFEGYLEPALSAAEGLAEPTRAALREIDARLLQPNHPPVFRRWEEEVEELEEGPGVRPRQRRRRAAASRYMAVSCAVAADPPSTLTYGLGALDDPTHSGAVQAAYRSRVLAALFREG